ncbi:MAG: FAD-binding oxidoreductase [Pseudomonadota bacterium]
MPFLFHDQSPIEFNDPLPAETDCVIVGGGVIGVSIAWFLRERGLRVLVLDKGRVAGEQSSRNWGWVRTTWREPAEVPIARDSIGLWEQLAAELGEGIGFRRGGITGIAEDQAVLDEWAEWLPIAKDNGLDTRMLSAAEASALIPGTRGRWKGGILTASDARCEPFTAVRTVAKGLQARGGLVREACAVRTIEHAGGRLDGIVTESGTVKAQAVVCAAGAWSNRFLGNLGVDLPQLTVRATVARTAAAPTAWDGAAGIGDLYIRRREDGGYTVTSELVEHLIGANSLRYYRMFGPARKLGGETAVRWEKDPTQAPWPRDRWQGDAISPFEKTRVLDPQPSARVLDEIRRLLRERMPALADIPFEQSWAGMIDATPDILPVMDQVPGHEGFYVATGFSGHGFGIGPGAGRVMARMIAREDTGYDLARFRFSRFSDGSPIRPGPAL